MGWIERDNRVGWRRPDGSREAMTFDDKDDADTALIKLRQAKNDLDPAELWYRVTGQRLPTPVAARTGLTFGEWAEEWLETNDDLAASTRKKYRQQLDTDILPAIGGVPLLSLDGTEILRFITGLRAKGFRKSTRTRYFALISAILHSGVKRRKVPHNAADWVDYDRLKPDKDDVRSEDDIRVYLTVEQFDMLIAEIPTHYKPFVNFLVETGVRFSEATALLVGDFDDETRTVQIRQNFSDAKIARPKSCQQRSFRVSKRTADMLKTVAGGRDDDEYMFRTPRGMVIHPSNFNNRIWTPAVLRASTCKMHPPKTRTGRSSCKCSGYLRTKKKPTPHNMRHTWASWMLTAGEPVEKISRQLGHSSIEITMKIYARFLRKDDDSCADRIDELRGR